MDLSPKKALCHSHFFSRICPVITCPYHSFGLRMLETIPPRSTTESNRRNIFREWYPVHRVMQMMSSCDRTDLSRVDWNIKYAAFLFLHLLNLPISWGSDQPWIWKQRSEGRGWRDKGRTHRCWRQEWGRGMAGPKCLNLNRIRIPAFSGTDAVRIGTGWWQCPERQAEEEEEGQKSLEIGWIRWRSCPVIILEVIWDTMTLLWQYDRRTHLCNFQGLSFAVRSIHVLSGCERLLSCFPSHTPLPGCKNWWCGGRCFSTKANSASEGKRAKRRWLRESQRGESKVGF